MTPHDISLPYGMKPREIATKLIANGYLPCPLQPRSKAVTVPNWTRRTFLPEDFGPDRGVGLKTGNGLVALDIDVYDATMAEELVEEFRNHNGSFYGPCEPVPFDGCE